MRDFGFTAVYQGKRCSFVISEVSGGNGAWHLMIDDIYKGKFSFRDERWTFLPHKVEYFTADQIVILEEQMRKYQEEQGS